MIEHKHINKIIIALVLVAALFTGIFATDSGLLGIESAYAEPEYASELFPENEVVSIKIDADADEWATMLENATAEEFISCDITINGKTYKSVGIRPKGNSSLQSVASSESDRFSFKIKFDEYVDGQTCYGLSEMVINNMQGDATNMKEYLSYDLFEQMGVDSPLCAYADISVNEDPWGLYLAVETIDQEFAERVYGKDYGELYKPESQDIGAGGGPGGERPEGMTKGAITMKGQRPEGMTHGAIVMEGQRPEGMEGMPGGKGESGKGADLVYTDDNSESYSQIFDNAVFGASASDKNKIIRALKALSTGENLEEYVDTEEVLRYFAVNTALVNCDSYICSFKHNYYLYETDGKISILPWDLNLSFAGFQSNDATDAVNFAVDTPVVMGVSLAERPLIGTLLANEKYKNQYHEYLQEIVDDYFKSGYFEGEIDRLDALIGDYVKNDKTAFYTYDQYTKAVETLKEFGALRAKSIAGQIEGSIPAAAELQKEDSKNLVDASGIKISDMGSQGGGTREGQGRGPEQGEDYFLPLNMRE